QRIFNQALRPQLLPTSRDDLLLSQAMAREAGRKAFESLLDERPNIDIDLVIAGGGVLTHTAHPAQAALIILDALQLSATGLMMSELYVDTLGLLPICGALAPYNPDAAYC